MWSTTGDGRSPAATCFSFSSREPATKMSTLARSLSNRAPQDSSLNIRLFLASIQWTAPSVKAALAGSANRCMGTQRDRMCAKAAPEPLDRAVMAEAL